jgi:hypothetical protein
MMKRTGSETHIVEIHETAHFDTGMIERQVFIDGKPVYSETCTAIIDRNKTEVTPLKRFIDWLLGIERKVEVLPPKNVKSPMPNLLPNCINWIISKFNKNWKY